MHRCVGFYVVEQQPLYHVHKSLHRYRRAPANWLPLTRVMHRNCKRWNCISVSFSPALSPSLSLGPSRSAVSGCRAPYLCCLLSGPVVVVAVVVVATYASLLCVSLCLLSKCIWREPFPVASFHFPVSRSRSHSWHLRVCVCVDFPKRFQSTHTAQERNKERCHKAKKAIDMAFLWMVRLIRRRSCCCSMSATTSDSSAECRVRANSVQSDRKMQPTHSRSHD